MSRVVIACSVSLALLSARSATSQTIPEIARTKPSNPIVRGVLGHVPPISIEELSQSADLIVEATLVSPKSYLTEDEWNILTDYQLADLRLIAGQPASGLRTTPGQLTASILTVYGGEITIEGIKVRAVDYNLDDIRPGRRYLLFLRQVGAIPGRYHLQHRGVFEIEQQRLKPLLVRSGDFYKDIANAGYDATLARIRKATALRK